MIELFQEILGENAIGVLYKAVQKYGLGQIDKAIEENGELKVELLKLKTKAEYDELDEAGLTEEIADELIMILQLLIMEDLDCSVYHLMLHKIHKLDQKMEREEW